MKHIVRLAAAAVFVGALGVVSYGGSVDLPARGVAEGSTFRVGCGDGKVMIGVRGRMGMFFGKLEALCRAISTEGRWLGSTSNSSESGGAGSVYPTPTQPFSISCPENNAVEGLSGRFDGFVIQITLRCFNQGALAEGIGVTRSVTAPLHAGSSTAWSEERCPQGKAARGLHGQFTTAGVRSIGLVCHSGNTPNLEVLAAPNNIAAMNLATATGPQTSTVTPFIQVQWRDQSTYESGFQLIFARTDGGSGRTIDRPPASGIGALQALNIVDLPGGGYLFQVCSKFPPSDSANRCSLPMVLVSVAQAATCSPTITSVETIGSDLRRVRWSHTCANPTNFIIQVSSGGSAFGTVATTLDGTARQENFNAPNTGTTNQVRVCAFFPGQGQTSFCSASRNV